MPYKLAVAVLVPASRYSGTTLASTSNMGARQILGRQLIIIVIIKDWPKGCSFLYGNTEDQ